MLMMAKLFGCFKKDKNSIKSPEKVSEDVSTETAFRLNLMSPMQGDPPEAKEVRAGVFRQIFKLRRRTQDEKILRYEQRYLKKFLRHQNVYVSGMTVEEMRSAKRLLLEPDQRTDFCLHCCHCFDCNDIGQGTADAMVQKIMKKELESDENQDTPTKENVVDKNQSTLEATLKISMVCDNQGRECSGTMATICSDSEASMKGKVDRVEIPSVLELAGVATTTTRVDCELQSYDEMQRTESSAIPEPPAKEKVHLQLITVECYGQETSAKDWEPQPLEGLPLLSTAVGEPKEGQCSQAKQTTVFSDDPEHLAKEMVAVVDENVHTKGTTMKESSEEPFKQSIGDAKCNEGKKSSDVSFHELEPSTKEWQVRTYDQFPVQSVEEPSSEETNEGKSDEERKLIIDKTGKMTPEEVKRNNELHAHVLRWFESMEDVMSFLGGSSDDGLTYVSLEQPDP